MKPLLFCFTHFIGLALWSPFSGSYQEIDWNFDIFLKFAMISTMSTFSYACLGFGLSYIPISTAIIVRVSDRQRRVAPHAFIQ